MRNTPWLLLTIFPLCACSSESEPKDPWDGNTYLLEVPKNNWSEPRGIGDEIGEFVPFFMLQATADDDGGYTIKIGTSNSEAEQDLCTPTSVFEATSGAKGEITIGPGDFPVHLQHVSEDVAVNATIHDLTISNVFPPAEEGELTAIMDIRELYPLFTLIPDPSTETVCNALESFEAPCEVCPFDGKAFCLSLKAVRLGATRIEAAVETVEVDADWENTGGAGGAGGQGNASCEN